MKRRLAIIDRRVKRVASETRPRVFVVLTTSPLFTVGPGSTLDELVSRAGGINIFGDLKKPYASVSAEAVVERNPDVILLAHDVTPGEGVAIVAGMPGLGATRAAESGRVIDDIDPNILVHPNHRLVDGIEALHRALFNSER